MKRILLVVLGWIPVACGSDSVAPQLTNVAGQWSYRVEGLSDGGTVRCSMLSEGRLLLDRSAAHVEGRYAGGTIQCQGADIEEIDLVSGSVVNGTIDRMDQGAQNVTFDLDGSSWHQTGSLSGDRMSGALTVDHVFAGKIGHALLVGTWTAQKLSVIPPKPTPH
jgi:hypothetical protein